MISFVDLYNAVCIDGTLSRIQQTSMVSETGITTPPARHTFTFAVSIANGTSAHENVASDMMQSMEKVNGTRINSPAEVFHTIPV